ncbi:MAG: hypothetical protein AAF657_36025 [Acidobacteriota bacterium]
MKYFPISNFAWLSILAIFGCGPTWHGTVIFSLDIELDAPGEESLAGAAVWMLDLSEFVQGPKSRHGIFVCELNENTACSRRVEYGYCAEREVWQPRFLKPALEVNQRFMIVVTEHGSRSRVIGHSPLPELTPRQTWGYETIRLRKLEGLDSKQTLEVVQRLDLLILDGAEGRIPNPW